MRPLVEATVADASGSMKAAFFNQPWLVQRYPAGTRLVLHGKLQGRNRFSVQAHARTGDAGVEAGAVAHYPATEGLSSTQIFALVREHAHLIEVVPSRCRWRCARASACRAGRTRCARCTFPPSRPMPTWAGAGWRSTSCCSPSSRCCGAAGPASWRRARLLDGERELTARWLSDMLPFALTGDQVRALEAIDADLARSRPMQRLLMGEVGSGKTVVALYALLRAVEHGYQGALMAPTETLAEQHFATIQALMPAQSRCRPGC